VLGADTTVVIDNQILGQPVDDDDARRMLNLLSGRWHEVLTGVAAIRIGSETRVAHESTRVRFAEMSAREIDWYVATGEARGKAGAYGIQGAAGLFIEQIDGDYFNIVGLPIRLVYELTREI
jgi:septum formation protein